jgi:hypothetical protein
VSEGVSERVECESSTPPPPPLFKEIVHEMAGHAQEKTASSHWSWWGPGAVAPGSADRGV